MTGSGVSSVFEDPRRDTASLHDWIDIDRRVVSDDWSSDVPIVSRAGAVKDIAFPTALPDCVA